MRTFQGVFCALLCVAGLQGANAACSRPVEVAFSAIAPDMNASDGKTHDGVAVEFLDEISARTGCKFTYVDVPRARAWYMLTNKLVDIVPAAIQNPERDLAGTYFDHVVLEPVSLISLNTRKVTLDNSAAVLSSRMLLGMVRGHAYGPKFVTLTGNPALGARLSQVADPQTLARMLQAGHVDAVIMMASIFVDAAKEAGISDQIHAQAIDDLDWGSSGMYLTNSRLPAADIETLKAAIIKLNQEGFYSKKIKQTMKSMPDWATHGFRYVPLKTN